MCAAVNCLWRTVMEIPKTTQVLVDFEIVMLFVTHDALQNRFRVKNSKLNGQNANLKLILVDGKPLHFTFWHLVSSVTHFGEL